MIAIAIILMVILIMLGVPFWLGIMVAAPIGIIAYYGMAPAMFGSLLYDQIASVNLMAVPMFIFAGQIFAYGGAGEALVKFLVKWMGRLPGGPAYALIVAFVMFGAMTSSAVAAVASFGPLMLPLMMKCGYSKKFTVGLLVTGSTLCPLIPPSITILVAGFVAQESIKDLFAAAVVPGILIAGFMAVTVYIYTRFMGQYNAPPAVSWSEKWQSLIKALPVMCMPFAVMLPLYLGILAPSETAAVCALYSLLLGFVYKGTTWSRFKTAVSEATHLTTVIILILMAAFILSLSLNYAGIPDAVSKWIVAANFSAPVLILVVIIVYMVLGCLVPLLPVTVILLPIIKPTLLTLGISPVAFIILLAIEQELAAVTPPFGTALFSAQAIFKEDFTFVTRSTMMFWPSIIVASFVIAYVPAISLWLPQFLK